MHHLYVSSIFLVVSFGGALLGIWLTRRLPRQFLQEDSRTSFLQILGLISMITALILGLVTASAKNSFDQIDRSVRVSDIELLTLDRMLEQYGSSTKEMRAELKSAMKESLDSKAIKNSSEELMVQSKLLIAVENLVDSVRMLKPRDPYHMILHNQALAVGENLLKSRWMILNNVGSSVPQLFLGILLLWIFFIFLGYGMMAPINPVVISMFFVGAFSISSVIFLILELDGGFDGFIYVSSEPLRITYELLSIHKQ